MKVPFFSFHSLQITLHAYPEHLFVVGKKVPNATRLVDQVIGGIELFYYVAQQLWETRKEGAKGHIANEPIREDAKEQLQTVAPGDAQRIGLSPTYPEQVAAQENTAQLRLHKA
ncbi:hypothetical protein ES703_104554 [subsurface metagenome]